MPTEGIAVPDAVHSRVQEAAAAAGTAVEQLGSQALEAGRAPHAAWHNASDVKLRNSRKDPERLIQAIREVAEHGEVVSSAESAHGEKHVVDGRLWGTLKRAGSGRSGPFGSSTAAKKCPGSSPRIPVGSDRSR